MRPMIPRPRVLLLAAGGSRRFGGPKLLAHRDGESLLRRAARVALACRSAGCTVVLGASAIRLERELRGLAVDVIVNRAWRTGLSSSLRAGIVAMPASNPGALVMLADQVSVGPADLELLMAAWQRDPRTIVAARTGAVLGPPVILPRSAFRAVRELRGDAGAKALLSDPARKVIEIEITSAGFDVDTPADLARRRKDAVLS